MKVWGLSESQIKAAVSEAGLTVWGDWTGKGSLAREGRALHVRLCVDNTKPRDENGMLPFQKRGRDFYGIRDGRTVIVRRGRRLPYVTWEGHREFMRIVFRDFPEARIKTAIADYHGRDDFWKKHPETKGRFEGSTAALHY